MKICAFIILSISIITSYSADAGDWVDVFQLDIGFFNPFYAGYLNLAPISDQSFYYNYFPSENNPDKDPLIVRISAGPGCSPLYSAYYSKGPFIFVPNSKEFRHNPNNWNKEANLLFIESPAGVGFSEGSSQKFQDQRTSIELYFALLKFYQKFPELKDQNMYLSGQNYAGVIVPRVAENIMSMNRNPDTPAWERIKLGGFILNNPCTAGDECESHFQFSSYTMKFLKNHYFISNEKFEEYKTHCTLPTEDCQNVKKSIESHFRNTGSDLKNLYNECISQEGDMKCVDQVGILNFLNNPRNKQILHADTSITWKFCNFKIQQQWQRDPNGALKVYEKLIKEQSNLRIWVISGSLSGQIPITGTKQWFQEMKLKLGLKMVRMWEPWFFNNTINAGDIQQVRGMTFASVRSAGYDLWNDQPEIGYHIIDSFLKGIPL